MCDVRQQQSNLVCIQLETINHLRNRIAFLLFFSDQLAKVLPVHLTRNRVADNRDGRVHHLEVVFNQLGLACARQLLGHQALNTVLLFQTDSLEFPKGCLFLSSHVRILPFVTFHMYLISGFKLNLLGFNGRVEFIDGSVKRREFLVFSGCMLLVQVRVELVVAYLK